MGKALSKADILAAQDLPYERVDVPEWSTDPHDPDYVIIRTLSGQERDQYEADIFHIRTVGKRTQVDMVRVNIRAKLVALTAIDEDGNRIFTDEEVEALGKKNAGCLDRLFTVAQRLSGLSEQDVKELEGNSESGQT